MREKAAINRKEVGNSFVVLTLQAWLIVGGYHRRLNVLQIEGHFLFDKMREEIAHTAVLVLAGSSAVVNRGNP